MSEMVDRVARAMWQAEPIVFCWSHAERQRHRTWDDAVKSDCYEVGIFRGFARAAIEAMRIPTDSMVDAGDACIADLWAASARSVYVSMIDEALK